MITKDQSNKEKAKCRIANELDEEEEMKEVI